MNCLSCGAKLARTLHETVEIDECPSCGGVWADRTELNRVALSEAALTTEAEQQAEISATGGVAQVVEEVQAGHIRECPVCGDYMKKLVFAEYSAIVVDDCAEHGVWLDPGELRRVEAYQEGRRRKMLATFGSAG